MLVMGGLAETTVSIILYSENQREAPVRVNQLKQSEQQGFTLVELLVTLAVLAIVAALAVPSYQDFVQKRQITSAAEQITSFIGEAKSEAIRRNENVTVTFNRTNAATWCLGARLGAAACDCSAAPSDCQMIPSPPNNSFPVEIISSDGFNLIGLQSATSTAGAASSITFEPVRGIAADAGDTAALRFATENGKLELGVDVSVLGKSQVCNPDSSKKVAGYPAC